MKRTLAINTAKWLAKRENRDKLLRKARQFKQRMEHKGEPGQTPTANAERDNPDQQR